MTVRLPSRIHLASHLAMGLAAVLGLSASACVQLIAFEQPIIGQLDYEGPSDQRQGTLCDDDIEIGESALCSSTCLIEGSESTCDERVQLSVEHNGGRARIDVSGLYEVEMTLTVCPTEGQTFRLTSSSDDGARSALWIEGRALEVGPIGGDPLLRQPEHLPEEDCVERTFIVQSGRLALLDRGRRVCSSTLPSMEDPWSIEMAEGLESLELCFREPR